MKIRNHPNTTSANDLPSAMRQFIVSVFVLTLSIQPLFLFGQSAGKNDWSKVTALSPGLELSIETTDRRTLRGALESVSDTAVRMSVNGRSDTLNRADVRKLYHVSKGSRGKAVAIGAAVGAGIGTGIGFGALGATGGSDDTGGVLAGFIAVGAGIGAALGALAGRTKKTLVFEAR